MDRYICIHGHFYQPPRENPWLEAIERQESAYPYHDWNARITAECYAPNSASRILDDRGLISRIINNYSRISFNFGPTLLGWLQENAGDVYRAILEADRESERRFSGHGSALSQAYNHMIMPLAGSRDRRTQVHWGLEDFRRHFGREPEGMWLPETAVDLETLEILAEHGIKFSILAPHQAARVRRIDEEDWEEVGHARIDPTRAYLQRLPSGREIALFFYDGPISRAVAFEKLLSGGERFADRLLSGFAEERDWAQMVHIATDGETYGHHHPHGEMALSYALEHIQASGKARLTNYGEYLELHPPEMEVDILEDTSWSCAHGIGRWRSDCGCRTGGEAGWNQAWRAPLREALDWLSDRLAPLYEEAAGELLLEPWAARNDYIGVILDREEDSLAAFFARHARGELGEAERIRALKLLELQRFAMLMFTSCGWFFNELSGIETVQVIQYAGRSVQLGEELFPGQGIESRFLEMLEGARSNLEKWGDGRRIYEAAVRPAMIDLAKVGAHFAVSSPFERYGERTRVFCFTVEVVEQESLQAGEARLGVGHARVVSRITQESAHLSYAVVHLGDHNLSGGVREYQGDESYRELVREVLHAFERADFAQLIRLLDKHFQAETYSLRSLFKDEQLKILGRVLESTLAETEAVYRQLYRSRAPLMRFLTDMGMPVPGTLARAAEWVVNTSLRRALSAETIDLRRIEGLLEEAGSLDLALDTAGLAFDLTRTLERLALRFADAPADPEILAQLLAGSSLVDSLPFEVNMWTVQNVYYDLLGRVYPASAGRAAAGDEEAAAWVSDFLRLGENLGVGVPEPEAAEPAVAGA